MRPIRPTDRGYTPFAERRITFHGVRHVGDFRLKVYAIVCGDAPVDWSRFEAGLETAFRILPRPAVAPGRPGLGFVIAHQGRTGDCVVLCWWDRENELPIRILVREGLQWRAAQAGESICVWDLDVLWRERNAYVETMLAGPGAGGVERYLTAGQS
jgi:hypothetical protein